MRINSEFLPAGMAPREVARWERQANAAATDEAALPQLIYHVLLQLRVIKLVLILALVIVPVIAAVVTILLVGALGDVAGA